MTYPKMSRAMEISIENALGESIESIRATPLAVQWERFRHRYGIPPEEEAREVASRNVWRKLAESLGLPDPFLEKEKKRAA